MPIIHPGEVLREDIVPASGLSQQRFAERLGVTRLALHNVMAGRSAVSPLMALRLERLLGSSAEMWLKLQRDWDLATARAKHERDLEAVRPLERDE